ncbi:MAG: mechanosensitive ion channel family protein, partial [Gluconacetobacter diazotrophicus]|nr:mechanosensitive ion channel family protein [Gluconacetobacter diazotrophicus]
LARLLVTHEARPRESRIVSDLLAAVIYVAAALGVVAFVFGIPVRGLLATSGVIAIVLGLALQNTLGDLFSGIAVGVERPYRTGDLLAIDGGVSGRVVQVNWRSTHIKVGQDVAIVPNSVVAKSRLVNRSAPTPVSGDTLEVRVHPGVPPGRVLPVLEAALLSCEHLAPDTVPTAECSGLAGDGTTYALHFAAASADRVGAVRSEVLAQVHRHLFHAGMPLAVTGVVPAGGWRPRLIPADELLARSDLFGAIGDEHRAVLAAQLVAVELRAGEVLFREGDEATALCLIASGTMEVTVGDPERPVRRHRLAPGETIGTVALVTGKPHTATATARNAVRAFRLDAAGLAAALGEAPGLAEELEDTVSRVLAIMARFDAGEAPVEAAHHGALIGRLRAFLGGLR